MRRRADVSNDLHYLPATGVVIVSCVVLVASLLVAITFGPADLSVLEVWQIMAHQFGVGDKPDVTDLEIAMVWRLRFPREVLAAISGAGLSVSGVIMQSLLRNPLAEPYLLGVSSGASTGAVLVMVLGVGATTTITSVQLSLGAFLGSLVAFALMLTLARIAGSGTDKIVLAGIAVTQGFSALTSFIIITGADANTTRGVLYWLMGSLANVGWTEVALTAAILVVVMGITVALSGALDAFTFGEAQAATLGVNVKRTRMLLLIVSALMTSVIVASVGAIGFVGLVLPHVARILVGSKHLALIPVSAVFGAIFLLWADTIARSAFAPLEVPVGVITAMVGVPVFAIILTRRAKR